MKKTLFVLSLLAAAFAASAHSFGDSQSVSTQSLAAAPSAAVIFASEPPPPPGPGR